jgi:hypothetical protein
MQIKAVFFWKKMNESHKIYLSMGEGRRAYCVTLSEQKNYCQIYNLSLQQVKDRFIKLQGLLESKKIPTAKTANKTKLTIALFFREGSVGSGGA